MLDGGAVALYDASENIGDKLMEDLNLEKGKVGALLVRTNGYRDYPLAGLMIFSPLNDASVAKPFYLIV